MTIGSTQGNFAQDQSHREMFSRVQAIFNAKCITCHGSEEPASGMSLEAGLSYRNLVNVASEEDPALRRIEPNDPPGSYLYRKIMRDMDHLPFKEEGMPRDGDKLSPEEINIIEKWIISFSTEMWGQAKLLKSASPATNEGSETFLATQLILLPTTKVLGSKTAEFRILHRFAIMNGGGNNTLGSFFGLDNGAITSINLSMSLNRNTDLLVRRSGQNKDIEAAVKYVPFEQNERLPVSLGIYAGFDWISRSDVDAKYRFSPNLQLLAGSKISDKLSVLLVPTIAFRSNHNQSITKRVTDSTFQNYQDTRATLAVGMGAQYQFIKNAALTGEYIPRIGGYRGNAFAGDPRYDTWSLGFAYKVRLHVFQILISNAQSIHTTQYIPGSSVIQNSTLFKKGPNFHFGFNIYRQFKW